MFKVYGEEQGHRKNAGDRKEDKMKKWICILAMVFCLLPIVAFAGGGQGEGGGHGYGHYKGGVPEIDPGMASSAIALLSCGVLILRSKRK